MSAPPRTISWWDFNSNTQATDRVGDNHGKLIGDAHISENDELVLDGDGDYVDAGFQESLDINGFYWTISIWVRPADLNSIQYLIGKSDFSGSSDGRYVMLLFANRFAAMIDDGVERIAVGNIEIDPDQWVHLTAVYNREEDLSIYVNGDLDAALSLDNDIYKATNLPFSIGYIPNAFVYFNGSIDDAIVFQKALTEDEIIAIYSNQKTDHQS